MREGDSTEQSSGVKQPPQPDIMVGPYRVEKTIGQGTYGKVKLGCHIQTDEKVAIKMIEKSQIQSPKQIARLQREIRFLKLLNHPHIVKVYDILETDDFIYIIMEYAVGGELFDYIVAHKRVKEKEARAFFRMVLSAVDYCHLNSVIHRDLKPENLLLDDKKCIKIIDFGFGNNFTTDGLLDTFCGSPFYAAPEMILGKKYEGPEVDIWSLGVILFALLCGHLPFDDENMKELYKKIASGSYTIPDYLMPNARHLIGRLITVDPKKRATLDEILQHPWVNEGYDHPPPNYLPERPICTDPSRLAKDIVNRLESFGYKLEDIHAAFSSYADQSKPHPIRSTYFLLAEMLHKENRQRIMERRKQQSAHRSLGDLGATHSQPITQSMHSIDDRVSNAALAERVAESMRLLHVGDREKHDIGTHPPSHFDASDRRVSNPEGVFSCLKPQTTLWPADGVSLRDSVHQRLNSARDPFPMVQTSASQTPAPPNYAPTPPPPATNIPPSVHQFQTSHRAQLNNGPTPMDIVDNKAESATATIPPTYPPPVSIQNPTPVFGAANRRFSAPSTQTQTGGRVGTSKMREDLRAMSGWFLNISTTSARPPHEIIEEVCRVLGEYGANYVVDSNFAITCELDVSLFLEVQGSSLNMPNGAMNFIREENVSSSSTTIIGSSGSLTNSTKHISTTNIPPVSLSRNYVAFQIELCKVPRTNLLGLHFKRLSGGVWNYKKVCNKLVTHLSL